MQAARKELCEGGFLQHTNGAGDQCGTYRLTDLVPSLRHALTRHTKPDNKKPVSKPDTKLVSKPDNKPVSKPDNKLVSKPDTMHQQTKANQTN